MNEIDTGLKSTISYTPTVAEISDFILAGKGVEALNFAMSQLNAANWELNVFERRVEYVLADTTKQWRVESDSSGNTYDTPQLAFDTWFSGQNLDDFGRSHTCVISNDNLVVCNISGIIGAQNVISVPPKTIYVPINTISNQLLTNSEAGNPKSQEALTQITLDKFAADKLLIEIEAAAIPFS